jgi:hypothetical protein
MVMDDKPQSWAFECADCNSRTDYRAPEAELVELYRVWPHVAALMATAVLDVDIENPAVHAFMEKHASHALRMLSESGEVRELKPSASGEIEQLWKAVYFAAGVIDEYQTAIQQRPELVRDGFCQSDLLRNALTALRAIAHGADSAHAPAAKENEAGSRAGALKPTDAA